MSVNVDDNAEKKVYCLMLTLKYVEI